MIRRLPVLPVALSLGLSACGDDSTQPAAIAAKTGLHHDFGMIRHRDAATHEFEVPLPPGEGDFVPLGYQRNCTCARHQFVIVGADGNERYPNGQPVPEFAVRDGEKLLLRLTVDTAEKEAATIKPVTIGGSVMLQREKPPYQREQIPVRFTFGILSPVTITPAATVDLGMMPHTVQFTRRYALRGVEAPIEFGELRCIERDPNDPTDTRPATDIDCALTLNGDEAELRVTMCPAAERPIGPFRANIEIETDLPDDYTIVIPVSGLVRPAIQLEPMQRIMFGRIDMTRPNSQQILVTDHNVDRSADFVVKRIALDNITGNADEHFRAKLEPTPGKPRTRTLVLDYLGTLPDAPLIRGHVELAKSADEPTLESVEFVVFRRR